MDANERNPYAVPSSRRRPPFRPLFVRTDIWIIAMLLGAGPLLGILAGLPMWGGVLLGLKYGSMVGIPLGLLSAPLIFLLVRGRPPWIVAFVVLVPAMMAALIGGMVGRLNPVGPLVVALPLPALVYLLFVLVVHFGWPRSRPSEGCPECGYSLKDLPSGVCPECGQRGDHP